MQVNLCDPRLSVLEVVTTMCYTNRGTLQHTHRHTKKVKVKASHTRHRALGPELILAYRQSARR